jgi:hypothetical protein
MFALHPTTQAILKTAKQVLVDSAFTSVANFQNGEFVTDRFRAFWTGTPKDNELVNLYPSSKSLYPKVELIINIEKTHIADFFLTQKDIKILKKMSEVAKTVYPLNSDTTIIIRGSEIVFLVKSENINLELRYGNGIQNNLPEDIVVKLNLVYLMDFIAAKFDSNKTHFEIHYNQKANQFVFKKDQYNYLMALLKK